MITSVVQLSIALLLTTCTSSASGGPMPICIPALCRNGGECSGNGTSCDCTETGYTGSFCETQSGKCGSIEV